MACKYKYNNNWYSKEELQSILYKEKGIDKYGKLVKPEIITKKINQNQIKIQKEEWDNIKSKGKITYQDESTTVIKYNNIIYSNVNDDYYKSLPENRGIQPKITNETLKESIDGVKDKVTFFQRDISEIPNKFEGYSVRKETGEKLYQGTVENINGVWKINNQTISEEQVKKLYFQEKEYTSQALINTKIAVLKEVAKKYPRSLIRSEVVSKSEFNEAQYQKLPSQLDKNQSNQIQELKQLDSRWNKYSNEDIQRFIDNVFPDSKVKDVLKHTTKATIIDSFRKGFGRLGEGVYLAGSDYKLYDKAGENKYHVLVNINNPKRYDKGDFVIEANNKFPSENEYSNEPQKNLQNLDKSEGVDAYVSIAGTGTEYNVFEPSQIYILNSDKAISDMEKFINSKENNDFEDNVSCFI